MKGGRTEGQGKGGYEWEGRREEGRKERKEGRKARTYERTEQKAEIWKEERKEGRNHEGRVIMSL